MKETILLDLVLEVNILLKLNDSSILLGERAPYNYQLIDIFWECYGAVHGSTTALPSM